MMRDQSDYWPRRLPNYSHRRKVYKKSRSALPSGDPHPRARTIAARNERAMFTVDEYLHQQICPRPRQPSFILRQWSVSVPMLGREKKCLSWRIPRPLMAHLIVANKTSAHCSLLRLRFHFRRAVHSYVLFFLIPNLKKCYRSQRIAAPAMFYPISD